MRVVLISSMRSFGRWRFIRHVSFSHPRDNQDPGQNPRIEGKQKKKFRGVIDVVEYVRWCIDLQKGDTGAKKGHQDKTWMEGLMIKEHVD